MLNVTLPPAGRPSVLGTTIVTSGSAVTFSDQVAFLFVSLRIVRCTVIAPGMDGTYRLG